MYDFHSETGGELANIYLSSNWTEIDVSTLKNLSIVERKSVLHFARNMTVNRLSSHIELVSYSNILIEYYFAFKAFTRG